MVINYNYYIPVLVNLMPPTNQRTYYRNPYFLLFPNARLGVCGQSKTRT